MHCANQSDYPTPPPEILVRVMDTNQQSKLRTVNTAHCDSDLLTEQLSSKKMLSARTLTHSSRRAMQNRSCENKGLEYLLYLHRLGANKIALEMVSLALATSAIEIFLCSCADCKHSLRSTVPIWQEGQSSKIYTYEFPLNSEYSQKLFKNRTPYNYM